MESIEEETEKKILKAGTKNTTDLKKKWKKKGKSFCEMRGPKYEYSVDEAKSKLKVRCHWMLFLNVL